MVCDSIIFCEVVAIYGLIMAIVFTAKLSSVNDATITSSEAYYKGGCLFIQLHQSTTFFNCEAHAVSRSHSFLRHDI